MQKKDREVAKNKTERLFNNRPRKVFRKRIPRVETVFGGFFIALLILSTWWFFAQKNNFDPNERDISSELMASGSVEDTLYRTPLQRWMDPEKVQAYAGGGAPVVDTGFFPNDVLAGHWEVATRPETFPPDRMWEKINGGAEQFIQFGCKSLNYIALKKQGEDLDLNIELYDMGVFENAIGIFGAQRDEHSEVSAEGPVQYYTTSAGAIGIAGPFYIKVAGSQSGEELVRKAKQIITVVAAMDAAKAGLPKALQVFADSFKIPFPQIEFQKSEVFQYGFANNFWFAQPDTTKDLKYFVHEGQSEEEVQKLFVLLVKNFLEDYEQISKTETNVVLKHMFLNVYLIITRSGKILYGIDGVENLDTVDPQMANLAGAFSNGQG